MAPRPYRFRFASSNPGRPWLGLHLRFLIPAPLGASHRAHLKTIWLSYVLYITTIFIPFSSYSASGRKIAATSTNTCFFSFTAAISLSRFWQLLQSFRRGKAIWLGSATAFHFLSEFVISYSSPSLSSVTLLPRRNVRIYGSFTWSWILKIQNSVSCD